MTLAFIFSIFCGGGDGSLISPVFSLKLLLILLSLSIFDDDDDDEVLLIVDVAVDIVDDVGDDGAEDCLKNLRKKKYVNSKW